MTQPTTAELAERQDRLEKQQKDQWGYIHDTRDRVAAAEAGMERLWSELHTFRTESREDARAVTQEIRDLGYKLGSKAEKDDTTRLHQIEDAMAVRRGAIKLIAWIIGAGVPAAAAVAGGVYYALEVW